MIGIGYDIHRLAPGETLILGGVRFDSDFGTVAHSDGDVLYHALCDAMLGAAALGDIGEHFPDTDSKYRNADSAVFVKEIAGLICKLNLYIENIDATLIIEQPKLADLKFEMKKNIARLCGIDIQFVNVKATTNERVGFIGRGEGIAAICVCQLKKQVK